MKTLRLLGMALIAILVSANFIACSSDDDEEITKNDDGIITNQKKLVEVKMIDDDGETVTWKFSYDTKGRLATFINTDEGNGYTYNYTWNGNTIEAKNKRCTRTYTLNDGLVRTIRDTDDEDWNNVSFTYNSSNQLLTIKEINGNNTYISTLTWDNGKYMGTDDFSKATYSGKTCKGYFPLYGYVAIGEVIDDIFIAHPELLGVRNSQLPDKVNNMEKSTKETLDFTYTFDKDGYVESCTVVDTHTESSSSTYTNTTTYTFKWE